MIRPSHTASFLILYIICSAAMAQSCSEEWLQCRKHARANSAECNTDCDGDSRCKKKCLSAKEISLQDCDDEKAVCRSADSDVGEAAESPPRSRGSRNLPAAPYTQATASVCSTNFGTCPMMVATPLGYSCFCATANGPIPGVTR